MKHTKDILIFWEEFLSSPQSQRAKNSHISVDEYGDTPELRDELISLILEGKKTATCSSLFHYEHDKEPLPVVGEISVVVDGNGTPVCITETMEVFISEYKDVTKEFAFEEGEGDRTLNYWREAHREFFSRTLAPFGRKVEDDMKLVCERFKVIYVKNG